MKKLSADFLGQSDADRRFAPIGIAQQSTWKPRFYQAKSNAGHVTGSSLEQAIETEEEIPARLRLPLARDCLLLER
jgi:hypothetical protein